jgi:hypothetical protein
MSIGSLRSSGGRTLVLLACRNTLLRELCWSGSSFVLGDDCPITAMGRIVKASVVAEAMQCRRGGYHGRSSGVGRGHGGSALLFSDCVVSLGTSPVSRWGCFRGALVNVLQDWDSKDHHHHKDPAYNARFEGKASNSRMEATPGPVCSFLRPAFLTSSPQFPGKKRQLFGAGELRVSPKENG